MHNASKAKVVVILQLLPSDSEAKPYPINLAGVGCRIDFWPDSQRRSGKPNPRKRPQTDPIDPVQEFGAVFMGLACPTAAGVRPEVGPKPAREVARVSVVSLNQV